MGVTIVPKGASDSPAPAAAKSKYAQHLVTTPAVGQVSVVKTAKGQEPQHFDKPNIKVHPGIVTEGPPAVVTVGGGQTIPTEPYANVKISVSVSIPCAVSALDETFALASDWVSSKMAELTKELST